MSFMFAKGLSFLSSPGERVSSWLGPAVAVVATQSSWVLIFEPTGSSFRIAKVGSEPFGLRSSLPRRGVFLLSTFVF